VDYTFKPPTVQETPVSWVNPLNRWGIARGISVLQRWDGSYYQQRYPSLQELDEVRRYWLGGYTHTIDQATADSLTAAGYGPYITPIT